MPSSPLAPSTPSVKSYSPTAGGGGPESDPAEAAKWYRLAAGQGHAIAQNNLGNMYAYGRGVPQDDAEAVRWYRQAAAQGEAEAQYNLGLMYTNGRVRPCPT